MNANIEDLDTQEVLARHDKRNRCEEIEINGRKVIFRHRSMRYLFTVEQFVKAIEEAYAKKDNAKGIREWVGRDGFTKIKKRPLGKKYYGKLNEWIERYREGTRYSPHVEAFHDACKELGIIGDRRFWFGEPGDTDAQYDTPYTDWFNELIVKIHEKCQSRKFKERTRLIEVHMLRSFDRAVAFSNDLFSEEHGRSCWQVIELTLQYESQYRGSITLDDVMKHRDKFFRMRWSENHLMSCVKAYAWAIEEGEDTGFHLHVVLFCLPVTRDDEALANQIGDFWSEVVTEGKGKFHNSNREDLKPRYEKYGHGVGVGLIEHDDKEKRLSMLINLLYLAKAEQQLQIKAAGNVHTFGLSDAPKKEKAGRPRNGSAVDLDNEVDIVRLKEILAQKNPSIAVSKAFSRWRKTGVPLPFPIEATVYAA
ncbi:inovirus-type Gp2 protein [Paraburkholderia kururiensis]|uniref:inovirus-type Gp2 protein n=1 Tax=Paraburkholderia kururiensis TaxID=984307 RepID=UPI0003450649|nr:inovirus-type Gp2 protein [Paraburkholderia kururiensis]